MIEKQGLTETAERAGLGIVCALLAVLCFSVADAAAKWLSASYAPLQIVFLRYLFGLLPVSLLLWHYGGLGALRTKRPLAHLLRALLIFSALLALFTGLKHLALAEAISVAFTAPLFIAMLAGPILGERVGPRRWAAIVVGFAGALVMIRPGTAAFQPEALYVLASALCFALSAVVTRRLARSENTIAMLTYTTLGAGACSLLFVPFVWQPPVPRDLWLFALIGLIGSTAAYFLILAYRNAQAAVVATFEYTALIWAALFGWLIWREQPEAPVWIGAAVIALAGLYVTRSEATRTVRE